MRSLELSGTQITDDGIAHLKGLGELEFLDLSSTEITDDGLRQLGAFTNLKRIDLFLCNGLTKSGMSELKKSLPRCQIRH